MKKITLYTLTVLFLCVANSLFGQDFSDPVVYNDYIVTEQEKILRLNINYVMESVHNDNYEQVDRQRQKLIKEIETTRNKMVAMPPFKEDASLRDEAAKVFSLYLEAFNIEFKEANLLKAQRMESYQAMQEYYDAQEKAEKKLELASERLFKAQEAFANSHNMRIVDTEDNGQKNMIKTINTVNNYGRVIFLTYFKISKEDAAVLDAMTAKDPDKMETLRKKLLISVDEGLKKLEALGPFKGDDSYRQSAIDLLKLHKDLGTDGYVDIIRFLKKKQADLTQSDVDQYNAVIEVLNTAPAVLITKFNEMNAQFMRKHIPGGGIRT